MRKTLEETWQFLESRHSTVPRTPDGRPFVRDRMPSIYDEEPLGFSYFRSGLEDADRSHLTMPRTLEALPKPRLAREMMVMGVARSAGAARYGWCPDAAWVLRTGGPPPAA